MLVTDQTSPTKNETNEELPIVVGALEINTALCSIRFDGIWLAVSPLEYKLLVYLGQNLGRVISTDELLENVWGCATGGSERQVKNCIWRLRRKIEPDCDKPMYVVAARGRGYYMPMQVNSAP